MYLKSIRFENVRALRDVAFPPDDKAALPRHCIIIGGNSTCKTTILRCIAFVLAPRLEQSALISQMPGTIVGNTMRRKAKAVSSSPRATNDRVQLVYGIFPLGLGATTIMTT